MKALPTTLTLVLLLLSSASSARAQDWVMEVVQSNPDSVVSSLGSEMKSVHGEHAPSFSFVRLGEDDTETLADYTGRTVVVNFWNTQCSGCKMQFPALSKLQKKYADQGLMVIYISSEKKSAIRSFWKKRDIAGLVGRMDREELSRPFQFVATPSAFVVDTRGKVQESWISPETLKTFEKLEAHVRPYLDTN